MTPNFIGIFVRTGTPTPIIEQVAQANLKLLEDKDYQKYLVSGTFVPQPGLGLDVYRKYVEGEMARWEPVVKAMGIKLD